MAVAYVALPHPDPLDTPVRAGDEAHDLTIGEKADVRSLPQVVADAFFKQGSAHGAHRGAGPESGQTPGRRVGDGVLGLI